MEGRAVEAEALGGAGDVAPAVGEDARDDAALEGVAGVGERLAREEVGLALASGAGNAQDVAREVFRPDDGPVGEEERPLDDVLQLADVARPGAPLQLLDRLRRERRGRRPRRRASLPAKWAARTGTSSGRSARVGTRIGTTARRK